jgi:hypothetical protein
MTSRRPDPILPKMRYADVKPAWIICRKLQAIPVDDDVALLRLAERGRLRPDDYVVSQRLDICLQAKEIAEIAEIFHDSTVRRLRKISSLLAWGATAIRSLRQPASPASLGC